MPNIQEVVTAIGFKKQSALQTGLADADLWMLAQTNQDLMWPRFTKESNAGDMGKGTPFATVVSPLALRHGGAWNGRLTSEAAAMLGMFGIGGTKSAAGDGFKYTCTVGTDFSDLEGDLPATTVAQACRPGASDVFDVKLIGLACNDFGISLKTGIGRDTAAFTSNWVGCGKHVNPSTVTYPSAYTEHALNIGGATALTVIGTNYVSNLRFLSCDFAWNNNILEDKNYIPGGGTQSNYNLMGRMRRGVPTATFRFSVEMVDETETDLFLAQTEGTVIITVVGAEISTGVNHKLTLTLHKVQLNQANPVAGDNGLLQVDCECEVMLHSTNGILTMEVWTAKDDIGTAAA